MQAGEDGRAGVATGTARVCAFAVHVFTAGGAALGLLALIAAVREQWTLMFVWLGIALIVDGVDGTIARRLKVAEVLPRWSGDSLDFVVDYVTYVLVPAYAITAGGLLPQPLAVPLGLVIVVTSALYFADLQMKMPGNFFRGFPVLWNAAAFYLFLLRPSALVAAAIVIALVILTFVPIRFIHPFRVARLRLLSIALVVLWSILALVAIGRDLDPGPWVVGLLCAIAVYFFIPGFLHRSD
jgi:phosphatidylcholine synthase